MKCYIAVLLLLKYSVSHSIGYMCCRLEETELVAPVQTRRASTAESELRVMRQQLQAAQKHIKELSWQIKMVAEPQHLGGKAGPSSAAGRPGSAQSRLWDVFGCAINYRGTAPNPEPED